MWTLFACFFFCSNIPSELKRVVIVHDIVMTVNFKFSLLSAQLPAADGRPYQAEDEGLTTHTTQGNLFLIKGAC